MYGYNLRDVLFLLYLFIYCVTFFLERHIFMLKIELKISDLVQFLVLEFLVRLGKGESLDFSFNTIYTI